MFLWDPTWSLTPSRHQETSKELSSWRPLWNRRKSVQGERYWHRCFPGYSDSRYSRNIRNVPSWRSRWILGTNSTWEPPTTSGVAPEQVARAVSRDPVEVQEVNLVDGMQKATPNGRSVAIALYCVVFLVNGMWWYGQVCDRYVLISLIRMVCFACWTGLKHASGRFEDVSDWDPPAFHSCRHGSVWKQRSPMRRPWKASKTSTVKIVAWPSEWQDRVQDWQDVTSSLERKIDACASIWEPFYMFWACSGVSEDTARRVSTVPWIWHDLTESQLLQAPFFHKQKEWNSWNHQEISILLPTLTKLPRWGMGSRYQLEPHAFKEKCFVRPPMVEISLQKYNIA